MTIVHNILLIQLKKGMDEYHSLRTEWALIPIGQALIARYSPEEEQNEHGSHFLILTLPPIGGTLH